jgi:hypothetical protein
MGKHAKVLDSGAEVLPLSDASVDAVVAAPVGSTRRRWQNCLEPTCEVDHPVPASAPLERVTLPAGILCDGWQQSTLLERQNI